MNRLACTVCLLLLSTACGTLEVRVVNTSEHDFDSVVIHGLTGDEIVDVDYGFVPAGDDSVYLEWDQLRSESPTTVVIGGTTLEFFAIDDLGKEMLNSGRYRYDVGVFSLSPPQLAVKTRKDE
jgi:hypothetical protein